MTRVLLDLLELPLLSVFPGVGLLDRAFEEAGFCLVRGPDLIWGGDVRRFHVRPGWFGGVIGGPPCQEFSPLAHLVRARGYQVRHPNLIPEFARVVAEGAVPWFLMENVPGAPDPAPSGYAVHTFELDNVWLPADDGLGHEQRRCRQFWFGLRGAWAVPDLRRWIRLAALELPDVARPVRANDAPAPRERGWTERLKVPPVTAGPVVDNTAQAKGRQKSPTVTGDHRLRPVAVGGSGKVKAGAVLAAEGKGQALWSGTRLARRPARSWEECCRLQGVPPDFLAEAPFTKKGKFMALGNGVPLSLGRAIAGAVVEALRAVGR